METKSAYQRLFDISQMAQGNALREMAARQDNKALKGAAKQFEAFFLNSVTKAMRDATKGLGEVKWLHSSSSNLFQEMHDQQMTSNMVKDANFGLAQLIEDQLSGRNMIQRKVDPNRSLYQTLESHNNSSMQSALRTHQLQKIDDVISNTIDKAFEDPAAFVEALWGDAVTIAEKLNVDPKLLIAQAALETGWGKSIIGNQSKSSFNLFNIKADPSWSGDKIAKQTLEYEQGLAVKKHEPFRSYRSFEESFKDYLNFLNQNPRYSDTITLGSDPKAYLESLQDAGYATDPNYADKVYKIYRGDTLNQAIDSMFTR